MTGVIFVVPFLFFSMPAGEMADKYSKQKVIVWTLVLEVIAMLFAIYAMHYCTPVTAYSALFFVALQAALFLPSKYAILPEIVPQDQISKANGLMTLATYLAIIFGTFLASFFTQITSRNYSAVALFCLVIAIVSFYCSLQIEKTSVKNPTKKMNFFFVMQVYHSLKLTKKYPHLLLAVLASSYFLYTSSFTQLNLLSFGIQSLHISDVQSGYILLAGALGIGIGSMIVALMSGKNVDLGIAIWGGIGTSLSYIVLYIFSQNIYMAILMIFSLSIHGGLFIVPLDAYIQVASPEKDRGEIVASSTFLGFVGVLLASLSIWFFSDVLKITAAEGYLVIGLMALTVAIIITFMLPEYFSRVLAVTFFKVFFNVQTVKQPQTEFFESILIFCQKYSLLQVLILIYLYPRISFIRLVKHKPPFWIKPLYTIGHIFAIPFDQEKNLNLYVEKIKNKKMPVCLFLDGADSLKENINYSKVLEELVDQIAIPSTTCKVIKRQPEQMHPGLFNLFRIFPIRVEAYFSDKQDQKISLSYAREQLGQLPNN